MPDSFFNKVAGLSHVCIQNSIIFMNILPFKPLHILTHLICQYIFLDKKNPVGGESTSFHYKQNKSF